jgi:hypothetical protein
MADVIQECGPLGTGKFAEKCQPSLFLSASLRENIRVHPRSSVVQNFQRFSFQLLFCGPWCFLPSMFDVGRSAFSL